MTGRDPASGLADDPGDRVSVGPRPGATRLDRILGRHERWILLAIVLLSVGLRVAWFAEVSDEPYSASARFENSDMRFFDEWARGIADGDWLGSRPRHPLHDWHARIAAIHFRETGGSPSYDREAARALWNDWYGGTRFHQEPLYPYSIAVTYRLFGADARFVYLWQMAIGVLINLLIYFVARRSFSESVAVVAAALAIGCGPLLFYETLLLRSTTITFMGLLTVHMTQSALDGESRSGYLLAGLCAGLGALLKSTLAVLGLGALALVLWRERRRPRVALAHAALLAVGMAACLVPVVARNVAVDAPAFSTSSVAAVTFYGANFHGVEADGGFQISLDEAADILGQTGGRTIPTVLATLRTHPNVGSWLVLCARKLGAAWHGHEIPNNVNYYVGLVDSRLLRLLPVRFSWIGALALAGILAALVTRRDAALLYLLVLAHLLPLLLFYVLSRFRAPLLAALIPFAAFALVRFVAWSWARRWRPAAGVALVTVLAALWTASPRGPDAGPAIRMADVAMVVRHWYQPQYLGAIETGDKERAVRLLDDALRLEPESIEEALRGSRPVGPADADDLRAFAGMHTEAARAHRAVGDEEGAARLQERARALERLVREATGERSP